MNNQLEKIFKIDLDNGFFRIDNKFVLIPGLMAEDFLKSELYQNYSMDQIDIEQLKIQKRIVLKIPNLADKCWYLTLIFDKLILRSVRIYITRDSMGDIFQSSKNDLDLFRDFLMVNFENHKVYKESSSSLSYKFPWGLVESSTKPDGLLAKIIIQFKTSMALKPGV